MEVEQENLNEGRTIRCSFSADKHITRHDKEQSKYQQI